MRCRGSTGSCTTSRRSRLPPSNGNKSLYRHLRGRARVRAMTEPWSDQANPPEGPQCPWCSAELKDNPVSCPSCGATLREETGAEIPGGTALDPASTEV